VSSKCSISAIFIMWTSLQTKHCVGKRWHNPKNHN